MRLYGMCVLQLVLKCHTGFISPSAEFPSIAEVETSPQQTQLQAMSKHQTSVIRAEHSGIRWIRTSNPRSAPCVAPTIFPIGPVYHTCDMPTTAPAIPEKAAKSPAIPMGNLYGGGGSSRRHDEMGHISISLHTVTKHILGRVIPVCQVVSTQTTIFATK